MNSKGTMYDWILHALHAGELIEQVEFLSVPQNLLDPFPHGQRMRLPTAKKYLRRPEAAFCKIRINTSNSKDGNRTFFINGTNCIYFADRRWLSTIDIEDHYANCPGAENPHREEVVNGADQRD